MDEAVKLLKYLLITIRERDNDLNSDEYIAGMIKGIQLSIDTLKVRIKGER